MKASVTEVRRGCGGGLELVGEANGSREKCVSFLRVAGRHGVQVGPYRLASIPHGFAIDSLGAARGSTVLNHVIPHATAFARPGTRQKRTSLCFGG